MTRKLDHIVYAVPDLEKAMADFEKMTGIAPVFGGYHTTQGTKNALVNLGNKAYLEFLAIDPQNTDIVAPRWMGIDLIQQPLITRWALKSDDLKKDSIIVKNYHQSMGKIKGGQRKTTNQQLLQWEMIMPLATPKVELIPFFCDWQNSEIHPTDSLPQQGAFKQLQLTHPTPDKFISTLKELSLDLAVFPKNNISIKATIETPKGIFKI